MAGTLAHTNLRITKKIGTRNKVCWKVLGIGNEGHVEIMLNIVWKNEISFQWLCLLDEKERKRE